MASRVNVKFVVALAAGLTALFALVAFLGFKALTHSGEDYEEMGDRLVGEGKVKEAADAYARAVGHDRTRADWLTKWLNALVQTTPPIEVDYREGVGRYFQILDAIAALQSSDPGPQRAVLDAYMRKHEMLGSVAADWQSLADKAGERYAGLTPDIPENEAIRRYRGLANFNLMRAFPEREDVRTQALEDLRAAVQADPNDVECALHIVQWHAEEWLRHRRDRRPERADAAIAALHKELDALVQKHPGNIDVAIYQLRLRIEEAVQKAESVTQRIEALKALAGAERRALDAFAATDPKSISVRQIGQIAQAMSLISPETAGDTMLGLVERAIASRPDEATLLILRGTRLMEMQRYPDAIAAFQKIADLPDLPISVEGVHLKHLRTEAIYQQAACWLAIRDAETDDQKQRDALAGARDRRNALVERMSSGERSWPVLLLDATIAMAESRYDIAVTKLTEADSITSDGDRSKPQILGMFARALRQQGQPGAAREKLERLLTIQPANAGVMYELALIEMELERLEHAAARLMTAREIVPDNERINSLLEIVRARMGETSGLTDPVLQGLADAEALTKQSPPDFDGARARLRGLEADHADDPRVAGALVQLEALTGDLDVLRAAIDAALQKFPDNARFKEYRQKVNLLSMKAEDRARFVIEQFIDNDPNLKPVDKAVRRYTVYMAAKRPEDALKALAEAASIEPDNVVVVDAQFIEALNAKRWDEAREIASRASRLNADQAGGLLYQARLELAQDETVAALATLERAAEKLPYNSQVHRMLGQVRFNQGQVDRAVASLATAYSYKPQDLNTAFIYAQTLAALQREGEALAVARQARKIHRADPALAELWVALEETAGSRETAVSERQKRHASDPTNRRNTLSLVRLLLDEKRWDESKALIEELRSAAGTDPVDFAAVEARWHAYQGGEGVERGAEIIKSAIGALPPDVATVRPYLLLAQYYVEFAQDEKALAAFDQAAKSQSPKVMEADRAKAEHLFTSGRFEESLPVYKKLIEAGAESDDPQFYRLRTVEALVRLGGRWDEAGQAIGAIPQDAAKDVRVLLLRAEVARGKGDARLAAEHLREAVAVAPSDPRPFIQRAMFNMENPDMQRDVLADLQQALNLQPGSVYARQMRFEIFRRKAQWSEAIAELRAGIEANPAADDLRMLLIKQLLLLDRAEEARAAADQACRANPESAFWHRETGNVFSRGGADYSRQAREAQTTAKLEEFAILSTDMYAKAAEYYRTSHTLRTDDTSTYLLANALLSAASGAPPKSRREIRDKYPKEALAEIDSLGAAVDKDGLLLVMRGRALLVSGKVAEGKDAAARGLLILKDDLEMTEWISQVQKMFPITPELIAFMSKLTPPQHVAAGYEVALCRFQLTDPASHSEILRRLPLAKSQTKNEDVLTELYRVLGTLQYSKKMYKEAAESFAAGVAVAPDDIDFLNNLAFTLGKQLGDVEGALPHAEKAAELAPTNAIVLDTLGWMYHQTKRTSQAESIFNRALDAAKTPVEVCPAKLHLAMVKFDQGDRASAQRLADEANKILEEIPNLKVEYQGDMEALMERLK